MLPENNRLRGSLAFQKVKEEGKMHQSNTFGFLVRSRNDEDPTRFGVVVSTKISKKAVDRNKVKRMVKEAIRENLDKIKDGFDAVILAKKGLLEIDKKDLNKELEEALKKGKLV